MVDWKLVEYIASFFLLKNLCLKNIKTYKNSRGFVFCHIVEFQNVATEVSKVKEDELEDFF